MYAALSPGVVPRCLGEVAIFEGGAGAGVDMDFELEDEVGLASLLGSLVCSLGCSLGGGT